ncbi:MAG: alpha/beta hydrolase, partial [Candidatus Dormibacteraeota bacterium]|nr:alpha/beta hydrolase [Candidatus Dormibacteraeota bacterium]
ALRVPAQRWRLAYMPLLQLPVVAGRALSAVSRRPTPLLLQRTGLSAEHARRDIAHLRDIGTDGPLNWYRALPGGPRITGPVSTPALYIWPDRDPVFTRLAAELTERHVTGPYHFVVLEGASHWIPDEHWDDVADLVTDHIAGT